MFPQAPGATRPDRLCIAGPQRKISRQSEIARQNSFDPKHDHEPGTAGITRPLNTARAGEPSAGLPLFLQHHILADDFAGSFECAVRIPQGATRRFAYETRRTGPDEALGELACPVDPQHEERQPPLPDPAAWW